MRTRGTGTSMAAPLVVGAAAQMLAVNPKLTSAELVQGLMATATDGEEDLRLLHAAAAVRLGFGATVTLRRQKPTLALCQIADVPAAVARARASGAGSSLALAAPQVQPTPRTAARLRSLWEWETGC